MADAASVTMSVTILPDEISKTIASLTSGYTPGDSTEKWYYKITAISNASDKDLITGTFISEEAVTVAHDTVSTSDKVKFLWVKNTDSTNNAFLSFDNNASNAVGDVDALKIAAGASWFGVFDSLLVGSLHVISNSSNPILQVAAVIDDVA